MLYKKTVSVGAFLKKGEDFKDGDIVEIANEGKQIEGQFGMQNIFLVKLSDDKEGNVSLNHTSLNNLIDGYGADSINWVGKRAKVWAILSNVQGKMIKVYYFLHPETELDEESGEFILLNKKDTKEDDLPTLKEDEEFETEPPF